MGGDSQAKLPNEEVEGLLSQVTHAPLREECWLCECFQGFIAQLELDAAENAKPLLKEYEEDPSQVRHGPGCEPCAPAEIFAGYLMRKRKP
jgi:hypothetical protein